ncbi:MAG TPA: hypothetical protein VH044_15990 [Polyangiaceae bacterium]|jgi:hypothetical protein|nr:hypothetical protein [Polyangiaceae bacterium]
MKRPALLRAVTLTLAYAHTFPARKHLLAFVHAPSIAEGWRGFGALLAIGLYLLPPALQARALVSLWRNHGRLLRVATAALAAAHATAAFDHVPRFLAMGGWADGWRGLGSSLAVIWFAAPVPVQAALIATVGRLVRLPQGPAKLSEA